jgi:hypothetical protein
MLSGFSKIVNVVALSCVMVLWVGNVSASKMAGKIRSNNVPATITNSTSDSLASISGSLLSWDGLGTNDALLSASEVERLDLSLKREGFVETMPVEVDCRGRFNTGTVLPGVYYLNIAFDGKEIHSHKVELKGMDGVSFEVGFKTVGSVPNVYVRGFGPSSSSLDVASSSEQFLTDYLATGLEDIHGELKAEAVFDELEAPVEIFRYRADTRTSGQVNEGWAEEAIPSALPSFGSGNVIIDPDVNVSQLHNSSTRGVTSLDLTAI